MHFNALVHITYFHIIALKNDYYFLFHNDYILNIFFFYWIYENNKPMSETGAGYENSNRITK
jgi:hypothetical protein